MTSYCCFTATSCTANITRCAALQLLVCLLCDFGIAVDSKHGVTGHSIQLVTRGLWEPAVLPSSCDVQAVNSCVTTCCSHSTLLVTLSRTLSSLQYTTYYTWCQGVPIRLELGPKDMENQSVMLARRDTGIKETVAWADVTLRVPELLEQIQVSRLYSQSAILCGEHVKHCKCCTEVSRCIAFRFLVETACDGMKVTNASLIHTG